MSVHEHQHTHTEGNIGQYIVFVFQNMQNVFFMQRFAPLGSSSGITYTTHHKQAHTQRHMHAPAHDTPNVQIQINLLHDAKTHLHFSAEEETHGDSSRGSVTLLEGLITMQAHRNTTTERALNLKHMQWTRHVIINVRYNSVSSCSPCTYSRSLSLSPLIVVLLLVLVYC